MTRSSTKRARIPLLLLFSTLLAIWVYQYEVGTLERELDHALDQGESLLQGEFDKYFTALHGIAGVYAANDYKYAPRQLRAYAGSWDLFRPLGGALGFGFVREVPASRLDSYVREMRARIPGFQVKPVPGGRIGGSTGEQPAFVVESIEPIETNTAALGVDIGSEPTRRRAAEMAGRTGFPALTGEIQLVQASNREPGFLLFLPVYQNDRGHRLVGWVDAPILSSRIYGAIAPQMDLGLNLRISDITEPETPTPLGTLSRGGSSHTCQGGVSGSRSVKLFGRTWSLNGRYCPRTLLSSPPVVASWTWIIASLIFYWATREILQRLGARQLATERERAYFRSTFETTADGMLLLDPSSQKILSCNPAALRMLGLEGASGTAQMLESRLQQFCPALETPEAYEQWLRSTLEQGSHRIQCRVRRPDGRRLWVELSSSRIAFGNEKILLVGWHDLSEIRKAQRELEQINAAIHKSAIVAITDKRGRIIEVNDNFCRVSGYSREELLGQDHRILNSGAHGREFFAELWRTILSGSIWQGEIRNRRKSGEYYWVQTVISPLYDDEGRIDRFLAIRFDVTEMKHSELKLLQSSKLASLGEMAAGVAHEINNPLASILLGVEQIEEASMAKGDLGMIHQISLRLKKAVDRIAKIVSGLKGFSRDGSGEPMQDVRLGQILEDTLILCKARFRDQGVELRIQNIPSDLMIHCRPVQISQVLLNLLGNALDAVEGKPGAWVSIEASRGEASRGEASRDPLEIRVTDSGPGIPSPIASRLMDPFFTTKPVGKGTGLGLSISSRIMQDHGGSLTLDRSHAHTSFVLRLRHAK